MRRRRSVDFRGLGVVAVLAGIFFTADATGFAATWANPSGSGSSFCYSNGGDLNGRFGEPDVVCNSFFFPNDSFTVAVGSQGGTLSRGDTLSLDVEWTGVPVTFMTVTFSGSYNVQGTSSSVDLQTEVTVTENGGLFRSVTLPAATTVAFPVQGSSAGTFAGLFEFDVSFFLPGVDPQFAVEITTSIAATSEVGGQAVLNESFGFLELQGFALCCGVPPCGDVNQDWVVDLNDIPALVSRLLDDTQPSCPAWADVNGDGIVDGRDIRALVDLLTAG